MVKLEVDIEGEPPPTVTWNFGGAVLQTSANVKIDNEDYLTKIHLTQTSRKLSGKYTIKAVNDSGQDEADVEIIIQDKPGKPEGPLEVTDIHKEGCKLKWNKPRDDGGLPLSGYLVEKMDVTTGRWVPVGIVDPDKTEQTITGLEPGKRYEFRVKAVNEEGESEPLQTDVPIIAKNPYGMYIYICILFTGGKKSGDSTKSRSLSPLRTLCLHSASSRIRYVTNTALETSRRFLLH